MGEDSAINCLVCQSGKSVEAIRLHDHLVSQKLFIINECENCGFRFIVNPPAEESASGFYETEEYVEHSDSSEGLINSVYHRARRWMLRKKLNMLNKMSRKKKILDFGTGTGYFLNHLNHAGFETTGVEISEKAREFGREKFGLDIRSPQSIFKESFPSGFGYITFWHVLEHVYNPSSVLKRLYDLLDDNGLLVVALPNYRCIEAGVYKEYWNGYDVPRHLWHWDKPTFTKYTEGLGFRLIKTSILPLDPYYNCLISESYRKKKWAHILIPFIGSASLLYGLINDEKASSIVYFLQKA